MLLFPHVLRIVTPSGLVDLAGFEIPPEAVAVPVERGLEVVQLLDGRGRPRIAEKATLTRIRISSPDGYALPGDRAARLKALRVGDTVGLTENLTNREALTVWSDALVFAAPVVTRIGYDQNTKIEYYSYQLELIHMEN